LTVTITAERGIITKKLYRPRRNGNSEAAPSRISIFLPDIFDICLCQFLVLAILLLPLNESTLEHIDLLLLVVLRAQSTLPLTGIAECRRGAALLAKSTVENHLLLVFESAK
jgi:hypothetical protein